MLLEQYIFEVLNMRDESSISSLANYLNSNREELKNLIWDNDPWEIGVEEMDRLDDFILRGNRNLKYLAQGLHRRVYTLPGEEWILKVSTSQSGITANKGEVEIGAGKHGLGAKGILNKIFDYDKLEGNEALWTISHKVIPLLAINDLNVLKKAFPTFWSMLREDEVTKKSAESFRKMISGVVQWFGIVLKYFSDGGDAKRAFYDAAKKCEYDCVDFEDVIFYKDFEKISQAYAYIGANDMGGENFGLESLTNPSPESIVYFDFGPDFHF
tara:strand:+ start:1389 stop:2198 length:810 start_codon:yes stop_codon:yes gene_type:complete